MEFFNKLQNKGIEKILMDHVAKYAMESGVFVDLEQLQVTFYDHDYAVKIYYEAKSEEQLQRFKTMLDSDSYLKGHI